MLAPQKSTEPASLQREPFERGLRELGWVPGKTVIIEYRYAEGDLHRLTELADELVKLKPDVIVARASQGIRAAQRANWNGQRPSSIQCKPCRIELRTFAAAEPWPLGIASPKYADLF